MDAELSFDERGLLPGGVHDATFETVRQYFGRFQKSARRMKLFDKLSEYVDEIRKAECATSIIINGSFVMPMIDEPNDVDLILVLLEDWDFDADLKPYQYNVVAKRQVKKLFGFDVFSVLPNSVEESNWVDFFCKVNIKWCQQFDWPIDSEKGIIRVAI